MALCPGGGRVQDAVDSTRLPATAPDPGAARDRPSAPHRKPAERFAATAATLSSCHPCLPDGPCRFSCLLRPSESLARAVPPPYSSRKQMLALDLRRSGGVTVGAAGSVVSGFATRCQHASILGVRRACGAIATSYGSRSEVVASCPDSGHPGDWASATQCRVSLPDWRPSRRPSCSRHTAREVPLSSAIAFRLLAHIERALVDMCVRPFGRVAWVSREQAGSKPDAVAGDGT